MVRMIDHNALRNSRMFPKPQPSFIIARVVRTKVIGGRVFVDAQSPGRAAGYWSSCPLVSWGGDPNRFVFFPVSEPPNRDSGFDGVGDPSASKSIEHPREVLLLPRPQGRPYALGMTQNPGLSILPEAETDPGSADHSKKIGRFDIAFRNAGASFIIDDNGAITLDAGDAGRIRHQLSASGKLRISRAGEADEGLLLADAVIAWINGALAAHLSAQDARITALEAAVVSLNSVKTGGTATIPATAGTQSPPTADNTLKSGIIEVSNWTAADEG